ncbi:hypothetical protein ACVMFA_008864 [Bradyrhizobium liaoningense]
MRKLGGRGAVAASRCREWTERELDKAIQAILEGVPAAKLKDKIGTLEARKHERLLEAVQQRLDANTEAMRQHRETVEHPFGTIRLAWERRNS